MAEVPEEAVKAAAYEDGRQFAEAILNVAEPAIRKHERQRVLIEVAEVFETRKKFAAMLCSEVAAYCREQAALDPLEDSDG